MICPVAACVPPPRETHYSRGLRVVAKELWRNFYRRNVRYALISSLLPKFRNQSITKQVVLFLYVQIERPFVHRTSSHMNQSQTTSVVQKAQVAQKTILAVDGLSLAFLSSLLPAPTCSEVRYES